MVRRVASGAVWSPQRPRIVTSSSPASSCARAETTVGASATDEPESGQPDGRCRGRREAAGDAKTGRGSPAIVTEVYEPEIEDYLDRMAEYGEEASEEGFAAIQKYQMRAANENRREAIEVIGEEEFDRLDASVDAREPAPRAAD